MIVEALALVAVFVPGLVWTGALYPGAQELRSSERLLLGALLGLASALAAGILLSRLPWPGAPSSAGALRAAALWPAFAVVTLAAAFGCARRGCQVRAILMRALDELRSLPALAVLLLAGATLFAHGAKLLGDPGAAPAVAWCYLGDILDIVTRTTVPLTNTDYGSAMRFEVNKIGWYLPVADWIAMADAAGRPFRVMQIWTLWVIGWLTLTLWVYLRSLTSSAWSAFFGTALFLWLPHGVFKLHGFRGEPLGMLLLFTTLWLALRSQEQPDRRPLGLLAIAVAMLCTVHLVPAAVAALWLLASFGVRLLRTRDFVRIARTAAALAAGCVLAGAIWSLSRHDPLSGQHGLMTPEAYVAFEGFDPADAFEQQFWGRPLNPRRVLPFRPGETGEFYMTPVQALRKLGRWAELPIGVLPSALHPALTPAVFLALCLVAWRHRRAGELGLVLPVFALLLFLWALYFLAGYHTKLPALHGVRREFMYLQQLLVVIAALALDRAITAIFARARRAVAVGSAAVLVAGALAVPVWKGVERLRSRQLLETRVSESGLAAYDFIRRHTPPDARFLADGNSAGVFQVLAGRSSLTEGRAPYFQPGNLRIANQMFKDARTALHGPTRAPAFFARQRVDYLVLGSRHLGMLPLRPVPRARNIIDAGIAKVIARFGPVAILKVRGER
ncbi:MAG: hypothetical protein OEZ06_14020 [Myxococcales bacterium]|nr:hypothetical protein [Myxococcales bacterium]